MIVRLAFVYLIGIAAFGVGFYRFLHAGIVDPSAFVIGGTCIVTAATIHVGLDLWDRFRRYRERRLRESSRTASRRP